MVDAIWIDSILADMIEIVVAEFHGVQDAACPIVEPDSRDPEIGQEASNMRLHVYTTIPTIVRHVSLA